MECLQVKLSKTQNSGLNYKTQTVASRPYIHPWTRSWSFHQQVVTYFSINQLICHWTELMSLPGILCHLEKCDWAKNRHFWRRPLDSSFHCSSKIPLYRPVQELQGSWHWASELEVVWWCLLHKTGALRWLSGKESAWQTGDMGTIPGSE